MLLRSVRKKRKEKREKRKRKRKRKEKREREKRKRNGKRNGCRRTTGEGKRYERESTSSWEGGRVGNKNYARLTKPLLKFLNFSLAFLILLTEIVVRRGRPSPFM